MNIHRLFFVVYRFITKVERNEDLANYLGNPIKKRHFQNDGNGAFKLNITLKRRSY
jgi:hypothetical protein